MNKLWPDTLFIKKDCMYQIQLEWSVLTFTSQRWFVCHGLGTDVTGSRITEADRHEMVSMATFVFFLFMLKKRPE